MNTVDGSRKHTHAVQVGHVRLGGGAPVVVQSMTNTDTADIAATITQVQQLAEVGSEIVRITVNNEEAARAVPSIVSGLENRGVKVPLVGDFHYNGHTLLHQFPDMAAALAKYRINPGNVGFAGKRDPQFAQMIEAALHHKKPVRIGVNWGSLDGAVLTRLMDENARKSAPQTADEVGREAMIVSALESAQFARELGMEASAIVLSCKVSRAKDLIAIYRELARRCDYSLHLGLTEAGMGSRGIVASTAALAPLLLEGIGDTIRVSLTPQPNESRTQEVRVAQQILQSLNVRQFAPSVTACPGCGRTTSTVFQELAQQIEQFLAAKMPEWKMRYAGVEAMNVAVMGCIVNGPGESKHANIGISLPGTGESPVAPVFIDGQKAATLRGETIVAQFQQMVEEYVQRKYG